MYDTPKGEHIFFILTEPTEDKDGDIKVIIINISTVKKGRFVDDTVIVLPRELPKAIKEKSFVEFRFAKVKTVDTLKKEVEKSKYRGKLSVAKINRILNKIEKHPNIPNEVNELYKIYVKGNY